MNKINFLLASIFVLQYSNLEELCLLL